MRAYTPRPSHSPGLVAECLAHAAASRRMWQSPAVQRAPDRFADARMWIVKARIWRLHAERELAANAAYLARTSAR